MIAARRRHRLRRCIRPDRVRLDFGDPTSAFVGVYQYDAKNSVPGLTTDGEALTYESTRSRPPREAPTR